MKKWLGAALTALVLVSAVSAGPAYDSAKVKDVMHVNFGSLQAAKKAIDATDVKAAVDAFTAIATADQGLVGMTPPQGKQADWDKAFSDLVAVAKKGADAASKKDWETAKAALADIRKAQGSGHAAFRS
jgi:hypothetical protein